MEYGLIGKKLSHSFSKEIHSLIGKYEYTLFEIDENRLDDFLTHPTFKAVNVTMPYKRSVIPYLYYIDNLAKEIGAVNTIVNKNGKLYGYNTDYSGLCALLHKNAIDIKGNNVLILGSGGTSNTAYAVCSHLGAESVTKVSRTPMGDSICYTQAYERADLVDVIINTTPLGMYPDVYSSPIDLNRFSNLFAIVDAVYNPVNTDLVLSAKEKGIKAVGGLYMLVAQAVYAFGRFTDNEINESVIDGVYDRIIKQKQNIVLIGMPGVGKTSVGQALSSMLTRKLADTDEVILERTHLSPSEIIKNQGENAFRDIESSIIKDISKESGIIISTGGGAVLRKENISALKMNGVIFFIDRDIDLIKPTADRPLSSDKEKLHRIYDQRIGIYRSVCDHIINGSTVNDYAEKIAEIMSL